MEHVCLHQICYDLIPIGNSIFFILHQITTAVASTVNRESIIVIRA